MRVISVGFVTTYEQNPKAPEKLREHLEEHRKNSNIWMKGLVCFVGLCQNRLESYRANEEKEINEHKSNEKSQ